MSLLQTAGNIISRLPVRLGPSNWRLAKGELCWSGVPPRRRRLQVLAEEGNYGALAPLRSITVKLLSKQMVALEDVIARLYATL